MRNVTVSTQDAETIVNTLAASIEVGAERLAALAQLQSEVEALRRERDALARIGNARLHWAMSCGCDCLSCNAFDEQLRAEVSPGGAP